MIQNRNLAQVKVQHEDVRQVRTKKASQADEPAFLGWTHFMGKEWRARGVGWPMLLLESVTVKMSNSTCKSFPSGKVFHILGHSQKNTSKDSLSPNGKVIVQTSAFTLSTSIDQKRLVHTVPNNDALKAKLPPPSPPTFLSLFSRPF